MKPSFPARLPDALVLLAPLALVLALRALGGPATPAQSVAAAPQPEALTPTAQPGAGEAIPVQFRQWAERRLPETVASPMVPPSLPVIADQPAQPVQAASTPETAPLDPARTDVLALPRLSAVMGGGREPNSAIAVLDGAVARVGDRLASGWTVKRIDPLSALVLLINDRGAEVIVHRDR